jgi:adenine-specific DNA-methyltransferase
MATGSSRAYWKGKLLAIPQIDDSVELHYANKRDEVSILATMPAKLQMLWQPADKSATNRLYYGDNLPILAALLRDSVVCGKVQLIYIDPPFATNGVFHSCSQNSAYMDLLTGAHYIEFLRARLILLRELLASTGSIYMHLDENMAFQMKVIMDEVFGKKKFRSWITRKKCNPKNYTRRTNGNVSDYILFYTKTEDYVWHRPFEPWSDATAQKEYQYIEKDTGRQYKKVPIHAPGVRNGPTGQPWRGKLPPPGKHWQFPPQTLDEMDARGEIYWSPNGNPRRKVYLDASAGIPIQDIWLDCRDAHNQNIHITGYPTEKPSILLERIIGASSNEGDLVLDGFAGSGTTLSVATQMHRNWIGIDNSHEALMATLRRFALGLEPMGDFVEKKRTPQPHLLQKTFDWDENESASTIRSSRGRTHRPINDFALFTSEPDGDDLDAVIQQWQQWVRRDISSRQ